jgi:hypothetical protein
MSRTLTGRRERRFGRGRWWRVGSRFRAEMQRRSCSWPAGAIADPPMRRCRPDRMRDEWSTGPSRRPGVYCVARCGTRRQPQPGHGRPAAHARASRTPAPASCPAPTVASGWWHPERVAKSETRRPTPRRAIPGTSMTARSILTAATPPGSAHRTPTQALQHRRRRRCRRSVCAATVVARRAKNSVPAYQPTIMTVAACRAMTSRPDPAGRAGATGRRRGKTRDRAKRPGPREQCGVATLSEVEIRGSGTSVGTFTDEYPPHLLRAAAEVSAEWALWQSRPQIEHRHVSRTCHRHLTESACGGRNRAVWQDYDRTQVP